MQVSKAGRPAATGSWQPSTRDESYAPLYLKSVLGSTSFDIDEMEEFALSRLRLLRAAGEASATAQPAEAADTLRRAEREHGFHIPPLGNPDREAVVVRDQAAHFLVRLALCTSIEDRQWFLTRECSLFGTRLEGAGTSFVLDSIKAAKGPVISPVLPDVLQSLRADLDAVARSSRASLGDITKPYYRISFEQVPSLVRNRRCVVRDGNAYVPERNVKDVVLAQFRSLLNGSLLTAMKAVRLAEDDPRMMKILMTIREHHAAVSSSKGDFDTDGLGIERISLNEVDSSRALMPLCMLNLMATLRENNHMKHGGRMQLGVFLKGCGLTMDESIRFWQTEFGKGGMPADKFAKQYAYNIRHHYGKEGKRMNLTPFSCMKIINNRPGPGEAHGCPYREFEQSRLKDVLRTAGVQSDAIPVIAAKAGEGNFQGACGLCFAATQPGPHEKNDAGMPVYFPEHPNDFFIQARRKLLDVDDKPQGDIYEIADEDMPPLDSIPMETPHKERTQSGPAESTPEAQVKPGALSVAEAPSAPVLPESPAQVASAECVSAEGNATCPKRKLDVSTEGSGNDSGPENVPETKRSRVEPAANGADPEAHKKSEDVAASATDEGDPAVTDSGSQGDGDCESKAEGVDK